MKKTLSAIICFLLVAVIGLSQAVSAASVGASVGTQTEKAKRTILLYVCGADLEEDCAMATYNLKQVMKARFSADEDVRCLVMTGGSYEWYMEGEYLRDPDNLGLTVFEDTDEYTISGDYNQLWEARGADAADYPSTLTLLDADGITGAPGTAVPSEDELMTDPEVLKAFINYGVMNYPAERYDLILWDHGGGPTGGYGLDEHDYWRYMTFADIIDAVSDNLVVDADSDGVTDGRFDFIDFDACLMSSVELCFALADYSDYYIASPETEPGYGQYYTEWLNQLGKDPDYDTFELGKIFVDSFMDFYNNGGDEGDFGTLSVIDLQKLIAPETGFVSDLAALQAVMNAQVHAKNAAGEYLFYDELASVRDSIQYSSGNFIDLGNFASLLSVGVLESSDEANSDWSNDYTEIACSILRTLSQSAENDIIYARGTDGMETDYLVYRDEYGEIKLGMMPVSGLYICFLSDNTKTDFVIEYYNALSGALEKMPDSDRRDFLSAYRDTVVDYALIKCTGQAVSAMINTDGYDKSGIDFDSVYEYWNRVPSFYPDASYSQWNRQIKNLFAFKPDGLSDDTKEWIGGIIRQQADEAITLDDVTADRICYDYGDEYILHLNGVNDRVVQYAQREIYAELPALEAYIEKYQENNRMYLEYAGMLSVGTVYGMIDDSSYGESGTDSGENGIVSSWRLSSFDQKWYAVRDAEGNNHVAKIHEFTDNSVKIPAFYGTYEDPHAVYLDFRYVDGEEDPVLDTIWYLTANGSVRGTKAKEMTDAMTVYPMIYVSGYLRYFCLPISETSFTITKDNCSSIRLTYTDIGEISDIRDIDDDGSAFYSFACVTDIYGNKIDVSDKTDEPDRVLYDIRPAVVKPQTANGNELVPVVEYDGQVLEEGVDYTWEKKHSSDSFAEPGSYSIVVTGKGKYVGKATMTFVIHSSIRGDADDDGEITILDATAIQRTLASLPVDSFNEIAADVDGDGEVTIIDATFTQRWLADLPCPDGEKKNCSQLCVGCTKNPHRCSCCGNGDGDRFFIGDVILIPDRNLTAFSGASLPPARCAMTAVEICV